MPDIIDDGADKGMSPKVTKDFSDAIDRLERGVPKNAELRSAAKRGALKINFSTVAKEAGRSRTLIALSGEKCAYPKIRARIRNLQNPVVCPTNSNETIRSLRTQIKELRNKLTNQQHQWRADQTARSKAERDRDRWKEAHDRLLKRAREQSTLGNVIALARSDDD